MDTFTLSTDWQHSGADNFWGEIASCDHVVQFYDTDQIFLDSLAGFIGGGINAGDNCIIIATGAHLKALESRLLNFGVHTDPLLSGDRYIPLDAEETLSKFMIDGWPDEKLFNQTISTVLSRAGFRKRRIRAFGEMVSLLWAEGNIGATCQLEHLWNKFCSQKSFCLYCAYPRSAFSTDVNQSLSHICCAHSKMISGSERQLSEVNYRNILCKKTA